VYLSFTWVVGQPESELLVYLGPVGQVRLPQHVDDVPQLLDRGRDLLAGQSTIPWCMLLRSRSRCASASPAAPSGGCGHSPSAAPGPMRTRCCLHRRVRPPGQRLRPLPRLEPGRHRRPDPRAGVPGEADPRTPGPWLLTGRAGRAGWCLPSVGCPIEAGQNVATGTLSAVATALGLRVNITVQGVDQ
jgi:hypothetical protein